MPKDNEYLEKLFSLQDKLISQELSSSSSNVFGDDLDKDVNIAFDFIHSEIAQIRKNKLTALREQYNSVVSTSITKVQLVVETMEEKYQLLKDIMAAAGGTNPKLTMAFRDQDEMSEDDIDSLLCDLEDLGLIPPDKKK